MTADRRPTRTSSFGVSRRESHDSSAFYERFDPPVIRTSTDVCWEKAIDRVFADDARSMHQVPDNSVALVVTSPPYFAGKEYEEDVSAGHVPATYAEYLRLLEDVFAECVRTLEPGGRIAVNVANLGRRPYRSLSADVIGIFERLRLLLRGEVIWVKARGASGNTAWGTFQRPANPVLRDLTERVVIASKDRFDRAVPARQRAAEGHPHEASITRDEFMEATTDVWELPPESATRVDHPAPFPVALPRRLIELYTYRGDLVLDPFMGSGTTAVAAIQTGRHYVGYETEPAYREVADRRIAEAEAASAGDPAAGTDRRSEALRQGLSIKDVARAALEDAGFTDLRDGVRVGKGLTVDLAAHDHSGSLWHFDIWGAFTANRPGLARSDTLWRAIGKAAVVSRLDGDTPLVLLTSDRPEPGSTMARALDQVVGPGLPILDVIDLLDPEDLERLRRYAAG